MEKFKCFKKTLLINELTIEGAVYKIRSLGRGRGFMKC